MKQNLPIKNFLIYWLPVILYCTILFIQSSFPSAEDLPDTPGVDKFLHFAAYAVLGAMFLRAFLKGNSTSDNIRFLLILSITFSTLYGISDEIHQAFVPARDASILDALFDFFGSIFGVLIYRRFIRLN